MVTILPWLRKLLIAYFLGSHGHDFIRAFMDSVGVALYVSPPYYVREMHYGESVCWRKYMRCPICGSSQVYHYSCYYNHKKNHVWDHGYLLDIFDVGMGTFVFSSEKNSLLFFTSISSTIFLLIVPLDSVFELGKPPLMELMKLYRLVTEAINLTFTSSIFLIIVTYILSSFCFCHRLVILFRCVFPREWDLFFCGNSYCLLKSLIFLQSSSQPSS